MSTFLQWFSRGTGVAAAVVLAVAAGGPASAGKGASSAGCTWQCGSGSGVNCLPDQHKVWDGPDEDNDAGGETHSSCESDTCATTDHHNCEAEGLVSPADALEVATRALQTADSAAVGELLAEAPERARLNMERQALQVFDCRGLVIAHLPVQGELLSAVANAFAENP